jgi:hypothetical protein
LLSLCLCDAIYSKETLVTVQGLRLPPNQYSVSCDFNFLFVYSSESCVKYLGQSGLMTISTAMYDRLSCPVQSLYDTLSLSLPPHKYLLTFSTCQT